MIAFKSQNSYRDTKKERIAKIKYSVTFALCRALFKYGWLKDRSKLFTTVKQTPDRGDGLFATQEFQAGELVFLIRGTVHYAHFAENDCYLYPDWLAIDNNTWIDMEFPFVKINHSCEPTLGIDRDRLFVALKDITPGDELTIDYSMTEDEEQWIMGPTECLCGSADCRTKISSIHTVPKKYVERSYPFIPKYFYSLWTSRNQ